MQPKIATKFFCLIFLISFSSQAMKTDKKGNLELYNFILNALNTKNKPEALKWIIPDKTFALNQKNFTDCYNGRVGGKTQSTWSSLRNRLAGSKSGFYAIDRTLPPDGYNKVYSHTSWDKPASTAATFQTMIFAAAPMEQMLISEILNQEAIPTILLRRQSKSFESFTFNAAQFISDCQSIYPGIKDIDRDNFLILLHAEGLWSGSEGMQSTLALRDFGVRFGGWLRIVENVREFVDEGAKDWFYGKCEDEKAKELLMDPKNQDKNFIIRSVPVDRGMVKDSDYVFAISYREDGKIKHQRIFRDNKQQRLWMVTEQEVRYFYNFTEIIEIVLGKKIDVAKKEALTNDQLKGLVAQERSPPIIIKEAIEKSEY